MRLVLNRFMVTRISARRGWAAVVVTFKFDFFAESFLSSSGPSSGGSRILQTPGSSLLQIFANAKGPAPLAAAEAAAEGTLEQAGRHT